jgi:hypothetical protein
MAFLSQDIDETTRATTRPPPVERGRVARSLNRCWNGGRGVSLHDPNVHCVSLRKFNYRTNELGRLGGFSSLCAISALPNYGDVHQRSPLEGSVSGIDRGIASHGVLFWLAFLLSIASYVCDVGAIEEIVCRDPQ